MNEHLMPILGMFLWVVPSGFIVRELMVRACRRIHEKVSGAWMFPHSPPPFEMRWRGEDMAILFIFSLLGPVGVIIALVAALTEGKAKE